MCCWCRLGPRLAAVNPARLCRAVSLAVSCLAMTVAGSIYCFNIYSNAIKYRFNLTQPQVELMAAMLNLGFCTGFPAGMFEERFGPSWTFLLATLLGGLAYVLLWSTAAFNSFFHLYPIVMDLYFYLAGFAAMFLYMGSLPANMNNFSAKNRGKVVTLLDAFFGAGAAIFGGIYGAAFRASPSRATRSTGIHGTEEDDVTGQFLMMSLIFSIVGVLGMAFVRQIPWESDELADTGNEESSLVVEDHGLTPPENRSSGTGTDDVNITGLRLVKTLNFHLLLWSFVIFASIQLVFYNNTAVFLTSFGQEQHLLLLTVLGPSVAAVIKPFFGWLSDALLKRVPRVLYVLVLNSVTTVLLVLCTFLADRLAVFATTSLVSWLANAALWGLTPTILSELFGMKYFARNWGWMHIGFALFGWLLHIFFGHMYQVAIGREGGSTCHGQHCFTWTFFILALLGCTATTMNAVLLIRQLGMRRRARLPPPPPPPPKPPVRYETRID